MLTQADFEDLARFRLAVRRYLAFAERGARAAGLTSQQHQALLEIKAQSYSGVITVGELAKGLLLKPHSAAELVDRLGANDMIIREIAPSDRRVVHVRLTSKGESLLAQLSERNLHELKVISPSIGDVLERFENLVDL
ncbi:MarR family winged helix-turn-helix transcriptional regulator [Brevundimonas sp. SL161]|uniref:MarR family winged helix-turn-helix transcriptional regulator n=1 Tax=Brevundimonas sp. SL161 TaxID=2804613 RepID=UPI003CF27906